MSTNIIAGDASNGFQVNPDTTGAMTLQVGSAGSKVNGVSIDATGNVTVFGNITAPKVSQTTAQSMVRVDTSNGFGSTNTSIRKFLTVETNQGADITYTKDVGSGLGDSFTINTNGVYAVSYSDNLSTGQIIFILLNATTNGTASSMLSFSTTSGVNTATATAWTGYLPSGSVIRAGAAASAGAGTAYVTFTIVRVA
jgi:hypothetical protein